MENNSYGKRQTRQGLKVYISAERAIDDTKNHEFLLFVEKNWLHNTMTHGCE